MKQIEFEDIEKFCDSVINTYDTNEYYKMEYSIGIIAKYDEAKVIVEELIINGFTINSIRLNNPEWNGYKDEYWIYIENDGIIVEPVKKNGDYLHLEASLVFVLDNCSSTVLPHIQSDYLRVVSIDDDDECDGDCENCCKFEEDENLEVADEDDAVIGKWESYFVNGKECDKDEYDAAQKEFIKDFAEVCRFVNKYLLG